MTKVLIKIKGVQGLGDTKDTIELKTEGVLRCIDNDYVITYTENQTVEGGTIKTKLTVMGNDTVVLERRGDLNSRLVIIEGKHNDFFYSMPQGSLTLGLYAKEVKVNLTEHGGTVKMFYTIDANNEPLSENEVEITVEEILNVRIRK